MAKLIGFVFAFLLLSTPAFADNILTWINEMPEANTSIEQLNLSKFETIATVAPGVATYVHLGVDIGCYQVRHFVEIDPDVREYSDPSNTSCKMGAPTTLTVQ